MVLLRPDLSLTEASTDFLSTATPDYHQAEQIFSQLLTTENLDRQVTLDPNLAAEFETALQTALAVAYIDRVASAIENWFLQRILYRINRLNFIWYKDLNEYTNERSLYVQWVRDRIEKPWQAWESAQIDLNLKNLSVNEIKEALIARGDADLTPPISANKQYLRQEMTLKSYRHLIAIASLDGLVESSRLCQLLGGASNEIQATLIRVLLEEYGNGRLSRKHSTFFAQMMAELNLDSTPEAYLDLVPWEVLASINHNFLLTQCKRNFLRYIGGFTYFEIVGPSTYQDYIAAADRLGLSETATGYWELHIKEDERHGQWMLHNVSLPLVDMYPRQAWELILGYDQDKYMSARAGDAIVKIIQNSTFN
ncbi:iron-containing redox enzyme family protein [Chamaesiphon sp.]|uniref:iron-containing redox enzyme family protein n=1 Tax=Chamaesiphon sp. TaxID=2814140 RepID=UPI0035945EC6